MSEKEVRLTIIDRSGLLRGPRDTPGVRGRGTARPASRARRIHSDSVAGRNLLRSGITRRDLNPHADGHYVIPRGRRDFSRSDCAAPLSSLSLTADTVTPPIE